MTLEQLNTLPQYQLKEELLKCCGSSSWVKMIMAFFPADSIEDVLDEAEEIWNECSEEDWIEAFKQHPKIGDAESLKIKFASTSAWASGEQSGVEGATMETIHALAEGNKMYEEKFGYIFIVCATGKSAEEMLAILQARLPNKPEQEIKIAAAEQNKITKLRIQKLVE